MVVGRIRQEERKIAEKKKKKKRATPPWDYLIEKGHATQGQWESYEDALAKGDISEAQAIEAQTVSGIKQRKRA